ncbi:hypothetical protein JCM11251_001294 [Rhodosporidiobolus azoricus]
MAATALKSREDGTEDELPFGDFCFNCGNATQGTPYCSADCRKADLERSEASPDLSPSLSAVPPLVPSAKSVCSTPPSSATNSPSPTSGLVSGLDDPPALDLPPPKHAFGYGGQSLPNVGMRFPSTWTISYQPDPLASPLVTPSEVPVAKDISFRRKANRPQSAVPSPLYFRQKAAAVHSSPAFGPTSPAASRLVPLHPVVDYSGAHVHEDDIAVLDLHDKQDEAILPPIVPTPAHCGRPGCVGVPARPRIDTSVAGVTSHGGRRQSWQGSGFRALTPIEGPPEDVLMSPRIRALRTGRSLSDENKPVAASLQSEADDAHSAFACYLFSHLSAKPAPERGRSASIDQGVPDVPRSLSVDAAMKTRTALPPHAHGAVTASASPARTVRPIRGMMGGRGPAATPLHRSDPALQPLTPALPDEGEPSSPSSSSGRGRSDRNHDRDAPLRPPIDRRGRSERMKLVPGHFISATTDSPSTSASPFPSPPPSPPTAGRGRSSTRRLSNSASMMEGITLDAVASPDPRGRSKLRGLGAVKRSMSPSARKESLSRSPSQSRSRSRSRTQTRGGSRTSYSRGRGGPERAPSPRRGRTRERTVQEEVDEDDGDDEMEERGRGRQRGSRSRSKSALARGRGREVVYSMGAYGHLESSDESDRGR